MNVAFYTLGCKVNQNETGALAQLFCENGFSPVQDGETADVYIVNSCTVTAGGDRKSRQWLRRAKRENPHAVTVLTGCFPQAFPDEALLVTEADIITGSNARHHILADVLQFMQDGERIIDIVPHEKAELFEELPMESLAGHTRAFMKIEDGCNRQCAYCVIPRARGNVRSRSESSILNELSALVSAGYAEVVLSGINLSSYGKDTHTSLAEIVEKAALVPGIERIRLGSLEPDLMDDACIARLANVPKLCPQFHLALQSGCDATLRGMRRIYNTAQYRVIVDKMRVAFPSATFTTDVIVGFPGETQADFEASVAFVKSIGFLKVHVFSYSRRAGTPAYDMPNQVDENEKAIRSHALQHAADAVRAEIIAKMQGHSAEILLETPINSTVFTGYTTTYVPVLLSAPEHKAGDIVSAVLGTFDGERCAATLKD
ncbi:MAG: tRNA (N(6)-L-threonylcarbamoyladenosine(37)-C(2))-methylthiotransferase MtaB [Ruthenibacterium sp.]